MTVKASTEIASMAGIMPAIRLRMKNNMLVTRFRERPGLLAGPPKPTTA